MGVVTVALEQRYHQTPDGSVWTPSQFPYRFWTRYLDVFQEVRVVARVEEVSEVPDSYRRADGEGVRFEGIPYYIGPQQYFTRRRAIRHRVRQLVRPEGAYILRASSQVGSLIADELRRYGHPYAVEVVCDPQDAFARGGVRHPLRPLFQRMFARELRQICRDAIAAAYVTDFHLQQRYPCGGFTTNISSVELPAEAFAAGPRSASIRNSLPRLIFVGSLAQMYKGADIFLLALSELRNLGIAFEAILVGGGRYRNRLENLTASLGLSQSVEFLGELPGPEAVRAELDQADVFVLPSRTEGLPRAIIEAMAKGLPCIATPVGGIPELLPPSDMVPVGSSTALAEQLAKVIIDDARRVHMSASNLRRARDFEDRVLRERRREFFTFVLSASCEGLTHSKPPEVTPSTKMKLAVGSRHEY